VAIELARLAYELPITFGAAAKLSAANKIPLKKSETESRQRGLKIPD